MRSRPRRICGRRHRSAARRFPARSRSAAPVGSVAQRSGVSPNAAAPMRTPSDARVDPRIADRKIDEFTTCFMSCPQIHCHPLASFLAQAQRLCSWIVLAGTRGSANLLPAAGVGMVQRVATVAFEGIEARPSTCRCRSHRDCRLQRRRPADKAVTEARERVRAALVASGLACRRGASPSISRPPTCPRRAAITICRSRSA